MRDFPPDDKALIQAAITSLRELAGNRPVLCISMSQPHVVPLVGAHFRPPAKAIIQSLPAAYPLELRPEPSNPYDANAVAVWFDASHLDANAKEELESTLPGNGSNLDDLLSQRFWQLGYLAKEHAAVHQERIALITEGHNIDATVSGLGLIWTGYPCKLTFTGEGKPAVIFSI